VLRPGPLPAAIPNRSTTGELPSITLKISSTQGRYGAVKLNSPRNDMFTNAFLRPHAPQSQVYITLAAL